MTEQVYEGAAEITAEEMAEIESRADALIAEVETVAAEAQAIATIEVDGQVYEVVDLRGKFTSRKGSWGTSKKTLGVVGHYNGPPVSAWAWQNPVAWIKAINDMHARPGRFSPGWTFDGIAYHVFVFGRTIYLLRDEDAKLPHCGDTTWNAGALAIHIPVGTGQTPSDETYRSFFAKVSEWLAAMGKGRSSLVPHSAVGDSLCPGPIIRSAISRYVAGDHPGGAPVPVKEKEFRLRRYNFLSVRDEPLHKKYAKAATEAINEALVKAHKPKAATHGGGTPEKVAYATRKSAEGDFGQTVSILVGEPVTHHVHPNVSLVGDVDETDTWGTYEVSPKTGTAKALEHFIGVIEDREKIQAMAGYRERLGKAPAR